MWPQERSVMDNIDGKKLSGINIPGVSMPVNGANSKIYIADNMGRIACLKPTKSGVTI